VVQRRLGAAYCRRSDRFGSLGDLDDDGIPNGQEDRAEGISTNPNDPDTYDMDGYIPGYASYGDQEIRCRTRQGTPALGGIGLDESLDWSMPGHNSVPPFIAP